MNKKIILLIIIIIITGSIALLLLTSDKKEEKVIKKEPRKEIKTKEHEKLYGLSVDSFNIVYDTVKFGNTLSDILLPYKISPVVIDKIGKMTDMEKRPDRIKAGQAYAMFCHKDSLDENYARYMVYENNSTNYTIFDFTDSVNIRYGKKPVEFISKYVCGEINSSLWKTLKDNGAKPLLALELSELYSWTIDFFAIKKGDRFRVIYEVATVDGKELYINDIKAAIMTHAGENYWAIPFTRNDTTDFYDLKGASLRKAFLKAPLHYNRISSRFTNSRMHPILKYKRPHRAVDYSAPTGTPIRTIGDGTVILRKYGRGAGYYIKVKHNSVYTSVYMHMSKFGEFNTGDRVRQGDVIGYVGSTGLSTGPHLHFEIHKNGKQINPLTLESPPSDPVPDSLMDEFNKVKENWKDKLSSLDCKGNARRLKKPEPEKPEINDMLQLVSKVFIKEEKNGSSG